MYLWLQSAIHSTWGPFGELVIQHNKYAAALHLVSNLVGAGVLGPRTGSVLTKLVTELVYCCKMQSQIGACWNEARADQAASFASKDTLPAVKLHNFS